MTDPGDEGRTPLPPSLISFISMQFGREKKPNNRLAPPTFGVPTRKPGSATATPMFLVYNFLFLFCSFDSLSSLVYRDTKTNGKWFVSNRNAKCIWLQYPYFHDHRDFWENVPKLMSGNQCKPHTTTNFGSANRLVEFLIMNGVWIVFVQIPFALIFH